MCMFVHVCSLVHVCACACARACVCVHACASTLLSYTFKDSDNEYKYELGICNNVVPDSRIVVTQTELQQDAKRTVSVGRLNDTHLVSRGKKYSESCLRRPTAQGTFNMWSLLPGGLRILGHLTGNSIPWSWLQWSSGTGGRLIRVLALTGYTKST